MHRQIRHTTSGAREIQSEFSLCILRGAGKFAICNDVRVDVVCEWGRAK